jgi:hypothetical protein
MTYCSTLTDTQLQNVLDREKERMRNNPKSTGSYKAAKEMVEEAQAEIIKRSQNQ